MEAKAPTILIRLPMLLLLFVLDLSPWLLDEKMALCPYLLAHCVLFYRNILDKTEKAIGDLKIDDVQRKRLDHFLSQKKAVRFCLVSAEYRFSCVF